MTANEVSMVQECVRRYSVARNADGGATILIDVPKRFAELWMVKLSELRASVEEIAECDSSPTSENR